MKLTAVILGFALGAAPLLAVSATEGVAAGSDPGPAVGAPDNFTRSPAPKPVPDVRFVDRDGGTHRLADLSGKVVLLNLWATWCSPCRREMPGLDRLQAKLGGPGFQVLALAVDRGGADKVRAFLDQVGARHLGVYLDPTLKVLRSLGVLGLPTTLLIDREGREVGRLIGPAEWDSPAALSLVMGEIAREPVTQGARLEGE